MAKKKGSDPFTRLWRRYVQYVNRTYNRSGGLWQGRYKTSYIQSILYLFVLGESIDNREQRYCFRPNRY